MVLGLGIIIGILAVVIALLLAKIYLLRKSVEEIRSSFWEKLNGETNTLIGISSRDKSVCALADSMNDQLRQLRRERHRYLQGDRELKEAVTNISHDLRTPLTAICGYLDLLKTEEMTPDAKRYLGYIQNRTEALRQLTEELFRYSVIAGNSESLHLERINVNKVLEESIAGFYGALIGKGITPVIHIPEKKVICSLDQAALSRIFGNVLGNVLKYSAGDLEIFLSEEGEITFTNTAPGLDQVQVGKLFDRFFSVESAKNSTGLGLAISKTLLLQMNGSISASYQEGRLSIKINLPRE